MANAQNWPDYPFGQAVDLSKTRISFSHGYPSGSAIMQGYVTMIPTRELQLVARENAVQGWHFLPYSQRLSHEDYRLIEKGVVVSVDDVDICSLGLHACPRLIDAVKYAESPLVSRVNSWGKFQQSGDKHAASERECLYIKNIDIVMHQLAFELANERIAKCKSVPGWVFTGMLLKAEYIKQLEIGRGIPRVEARITEFRKEYIDRFNGTNLDLQLGFAFGAYMRLASWKSLHVASTGLTGISVTFDLNEIERRLLGMVEKVDQLR